MDEEDEMIINEKILNAGAEDQDQIIEKDDASDKTEGREDGEEEENANFLDEKMLASPTQGRIKIDENKLKKIIEKSFVDINSAKVGMTHPKKPGVVCTKIYDIMPHYKDVNIEYIN